MEQQVELIKNTAASCSLKDPAENPVSVQHHGKSTEYRFKASYFYPKTCQQLFRTGSLERILGQFCSHEERDEIFALIQADRMAKNKTFKHSGPWSQITKVNYVLLAIYIVHALGIQRNKYGLKYPRGITTKPYYQYLIQSVLPRTEDPDKIEKILQADAILLRWINDHLWNQRQLEKDVQRLLQLLPNF